MTWNVPNVTFAFREGDEPPAADDRGSEERIDDAGGDLAIVRGDQRVETAAGPVLARAGTGVATSSSERRQWTQIYAVNAAIFNS